MVVSFAGNKVEGVADVSGAWRVELPAVKASAEPRRMTIGERVLEDVVVGEVWYASGQSNMAWTLGGSAKKLPEAQAILDAADHPSIRYRAIKSKDNPQPQSMIGDGKSWERCTPETAKRFSAVAFITGLKLHEALGVPVGIIEGAWGGHPIEPFIPRTAFVGHPVLEEEARLSDAKDLEGLKAMVGGVFARNDSWLCGTIYNSRVAPVVPYAMRGVWWYQAESNCGKEEDPRFYATKMKALIRSWRAAWAQPEMPVYWVQLPQYDAQGWVPMRDEQRQALTEPHTGMAVIIDLALDGIHPPNKIDVAERLVRWPLARVYGREIVPGGPMVTRWELDGSEAIVSFDCADLVTGSKTDFMPTLLGEDTLVYGFELKDDKGEWYRAFAEISGGRVRCSTASVAVVTGVRYGWAGVMPEGGKWNLYNRAGLPASPFVLSPNMTQQ